MEQGVESCALCTNFRGCGRRESDQNGGGRDLRDCPNTVTVRNCSDVTALTPSQDLTYLTVTLTVNQLNRLRWIQGKFKVTLSHPTYRQPG
jgi:hypothetical protein